MSEAVRSRSGARSAQLPAWDESGLALRFAGVLVVLSAVAAFRWLQLGKAGPAAVAVSFGASLVALSAWSLRTDSRKVLGLGLPTLMTAAAVVLLALSSGKNLGAVALLATAPAAAVVWGRRHAGTTFLFVSIATAASVAIFLEENAFAEESNWPLGASSVWSAVPLALAMFFLARSSSAARAAWQREVLAAGAVTSANAARLQAYVENAHDMFAELDARGRILFAHASDENRYVLPIADLVGTDGTEYLHPDDFAAGLRCFQAAARGRRVVSPPLRYRGACEEWRWLRLAVSSYRTAAGELRFAVQARDETELQEAQAARDHAVAELEEALARIETLRGRIAICSHCKDVKNEREVWEPIDEYVAHRSLAEFTHGLCPRCLDRKREPTLRDEPGEAVAK